MSKRKRQQVVDVTLDCFLVAEANAPGYAEERLRRLQPYVDSLREARTKQMARRHRRDLRLAAWGLYQWAKANGTDANAMVRDSRDELEALLDGLVQAGDQLNAVTEVLRDP